MKKRMLMAATLTAAIIMTACGGSKPAAAPASSAAETTAAASEAKTEEAKADETTAAEKKAEAGSENADFNIDNIRDRTLTFEGNAGLKGLNGQTAVALAEKVEELSQGKIKCEVFWNNELSTGIGGIDVWSTGVRQVGYNSNDTLSRGGLQQATALGAPFLFKDYDHVYSFISSNMGKEYKKYLNENQEFFHAIALIQNGARSYFFTKKNVTSYKDMKGMKIRVIAQDSYTKMTSALGADPIGLQWGDTYNALTTGMVDGAENPVGGYFSNGMNEIAPVFYEDQHIFEFGHMGVLKSIWDDMNEDEHALMEAAGAYAEKWNYEHAKSIEEEYWAAHPEVTHIVPTAEEKDEMFGLMSELYSTMYAEDADRMEKIRTLAK